MLESLVATAISGIFITSLFTGLGTGFLAVERVREDLRANQILIDKFETIRLYSWDQINTEGFIPKTSHLLFLLDR